MTERGGLLEFSNGLWWEDPLTGDLVCEVRTIRGIRQVVVPAIRLRTLDSEKPRPQSGARHLK